MPRFSRPMQLTREKAPIAFIVLPLAAVAFPGLAFGMSR